MREARAKLSAQRTWQRAQPQKPCGAHREVSQLESVGGCGTHGLRSETGGETHSRLLVASRVSPWSRCSSPRLTEPWTVCHKGHVRWSISMCTGCGCVRDRVLCETRLHARLKHVCERRALSNFCVGVFVSAPLQRPSLPPWGVSCVPFFRYRWVIQSTTNAKKTNENLTRPIPVFALNTYTTP